MNKSTEKEELRFGRWADMDEWFNEASCVKEKAKPSCEVETISVFGNWHLRVYIPRRAGDGYESAMETALTLLAEIGTRPENAYLECGYCVIFLGSGEFYKMKALAEEIQRWLVSREIRTTVGDSFPIASKGEIWAHLRFAQDHRIVRTAAKWSLSVTIPPDGPTSVSREPAAVTGLINHLGLAAKNLDCTVGGWRLEFDMDDFVLAKSKASQAIAWLTWKGYEIHTSWGNVELPLQLLDEESLIGLNETGDSFYGLGHSAAARVELRDSTHYHPQGNEEIRKLKRLQARLTESAEELRVVLNRGQVNALLDLAGECLDHQGLYIQVIDSFSSSGYYIEEEEWALYSEALKLVAPLSKITQELRNAFRCGIE